MSLRRTLNEIAALAVRAVPRADGAGLALLEDPAGTLVVTAPFVTEMDRPQHRLGEGPGIIATAQCTTVVSPALTTDSRWPSYGRQVAPLAVHSVVSLPLLSDRGVLGVMNLYARAEDAFDGEATRAAELFATAATISVANTLLLIQTRRLAADLKKALVGHSVTDRAVGILMHSGGVGENAALGTLRELSRAQGLDLAVAAQFVVNEAAWVARDALRTE
jgi:GAF domain-containing protein